MTTSPTNSLVPRFGKAVKEKPKRLPPFSLRLTAEERTQLETDAGRQPLGGYIKSCLFDGAPPKRRRRTAPVYDDKQIAMVLAVLGRSRLSQNMNQIAKAANTGTLNATPELHQEIIDACNEIKMMRHMLIAALGIKPEDSE